MNQKKIIKPSLKEKILESLRFQWQTQPYKRIIILGSLSYLLLYLFLIRDIVYTSGSPLFQASISDNPFKLIFKARGAFYFESIALVEFLNFSWIISPLNTLIGSVLAVLVGLNMSSAWLMIKMPRVCGTKKGFLGILGSLPALFSGLACCGPTIIFLISAQFASAIIALQSFLFPVGVILLVLSQLWSARKLNLQLLKRKRK